MSIADPFTGFASTATPAQAKYLSDLIFSKEGVHVTAESILTMERRACSRKIDALKTAPRVAPKCTCHGAPVEKVAEIEEGMYRNPVNGEIYKVQLAVHGSGKLYAKRLAELDVPREMAKGKKKTHEFEYVAGLLRSIKPEWRMTLDEAKAWGALYGSCCVCGTTLTDEKSIAAGIGPVCGGRV